MTNADLTLKFIQEESPIIVPVAFGLPNETTVLIQLTPSETEEDTANIEINVGGGPGEPTADEVASLGYLLNTIANSLIENSEFLAGNLQNLEVTSGDS